MDSNYYESNPILPHNARKTSDWTSKVTRDMHIRVRDQPIFTLPAEYGLLEVYLECIPDDAWRSYIDIDKLPISPACKTLVDEVKVVYNLSEYSFASTLFHVMHLNDYPLSINARHVLQIEIGEQEEPIVSVPDFIIRSKEGKMIVVVEDKFVNQWKENQVMGEIFVAAHNMKITSPSELYAIRIIGTLFTFYKATVSPEYIMESLLGYPQEHYMDIQRYPSPGHALDFCKLEHRKIIVEYLSKISKEMF